MLHTDEQESLHSGDLVVLPAGTGHAVRDRIDSEVRHLTFGQAPGEYRRESLTRPTRIAQTMSPQRGTDF